MKNLIIFTVVLSACMMQGNTPSIEEVNAEISKMGIVVQEALALCHKKCNLIKAQEGECDAAKIFVNETAASCHALCERRADFEIRTFREKIFDNICDIVKEEYKNTHK